MYLLILSAVMMASNIIPSGGIPDNVVPESGVPENIMPYSSDKKMIDIGFDLYAGVASIIFLFVMIISIFILLRGGFFA